MNRAALAKQRRATQQMRAALTITRATRRAAIEAATSPQALARIVEAGEIVESALTSMRRALGICETQEE